jgi:hypothetical protein
MSSIKVTNLQHASAASPAIVLASDGTATAQLSSLNGGALSGARNRIINGDMRIDQRNAGASVTPSSSTSQYLVDRWKIDYSQTSKITAQRDTVVPSGFTNSLKLTVASAVTAGASDYFLLSQPLEGVNIDDLAFGTASAKSVTVSFQVRSSVTGTYAVAIRNSANNRSYVGTYTINSANTFESKTVALTGDTSGTWLADTGVGLNLVFDLGSGSNFNGTASVWAGANNFRTSATANWIANAGATFYITGVQLEAGSVATPFERRSYGQELNLCQRYFSSVSINVSPSAWNATPYYYPVTMRATPTITGSGAGYTVAGTITNSGIYHYQNSFGVSTVTAASEL